MPGSWPHLAVRFVDVLTAPPLDPGEVDRALARLRPAERAMFLAQTPADQRHGLVACERVAGARPERPDLARAALLHDVGKRHARLGVLARVVASIFVRLRLPLWARAAMYRDHGRLAAAELGDLGAEPVVVAFAAAHHGDRPPDIGEDEWNLLVTADRSRWR